MKSQQYEKVMRERERGQGSRATSFNSFVSKVGQLFHETLFSVSRARLFLSFLENFYILFNMVEEMKKKFSGIYRESYFVHSIILHATLGGLCSACFNPIPVGLIF